MRTRLIILIAICCLLALGCDGKPKPKKAKPAETLPAGTAPQAIASAQPPPPLPAPQSNETLYVAWVRNDAGLPIGRVKTMLLGQVPEGDYMREPRRKTVIGTYRTPNHGRVHFAVESDSKPKYLWIGADGMLPFVEELPAARPGATFEKTVTVSITPTLTVIIEDHRGYRVANGILTMRPVGGGKLDARAQKRFSGAKRSDDLGETRFTRPPGKYEFIASKSNGTCRLTKTIDWDGTNPERTFRLPEKSPGK